MVPKVLDCVEIKRFSLNGKISSVGVSSDLRGFSGVVGVYLSYKYYVT